MASLPSFNIKRRGGGLGSELGALGKGLGQFGQALQQGMRTIEIIKEGKRRDAAADRDEQTHGLTMAGTALEWINKIDTMQLPEELRNTAIKGTIAWLKKLPGMDVNGAQIIGDAIIATPGIGGEIFDMLYKNMPAGRLIRSNPTFLTYMDGFKKNMDRITGGQEILAESKASGESLESLAVTKQLETGSDFGVGIPADLARVAEETRTSTIATIEARASTARGQLEDKALNKQIRAMDTIEEVKEFQFGMLDAVSDELKARREDPESHAKLHKKYGFMQDLDERQLKQLLMVSLGTKAGLLEQIVDLVQALGKGGLFGDVVQKELRQGPKIVAPPTITP